MDTIGELWRRRACRRTRCRPPRKKDKRGKEWGARVECEPAS